jgi:hypothetical protein
VLIGRSNEQATAILRKIHALFVRIDNPMLREASALCRDHLMRVECDACAEDHLSTRLQHLCEAVGSEINDRRCRMDADRRFGSQFLFRRSAMVIRAFSRTCSR